MHNFFPSVRFKLLSVITLLIIITYNVSGFYFLQILEKLNLFLSKFTNIQTSDNLKHFRFCIFVKKRVFLQFQHVNLNHQFYFAFHLKQEQQLLEETNYNIFMWSFTYSTVQEYSISWHRLRQQKSSRTTCWIVI